MLVLGRKLDESIVIDEKIKVVVAGVPPGFGDKYVKIGIEAPLNVRILRGEIEFSPRTKETAAVADWRKNNMDRAKELARVHQTQYVERLKNGTGPLRTEIVRRNRCANCGCPDPKCVRYVEKTTARIVRVVQCRNCGDKWTIIQE